MLPQRDIYTAKKIEAGISETMRDPADSGGKCHVLGSVSPYRGMQAVVGRRVQLGAAAAAVLLLLLPLVSK